MARRLVVLAVLGVALAAGTQASALRRARDRARTLRRDLLHDGIVVAAADATVVAGEEGAAPLALVVLGDSQVAGDGLDDPGVALPRRLGQRLAAATARPVRVTALGRSGDRTHDVVSEQLPRIPADAEIVVVAIGVNDALRRHAPARVERDTRALAAALRATAPGAAHLLLGCPDLRTAPALPAGLRAVVGRLCRRTAAAQARAAQAEGLACSFPPGLPPPELYGPDGFHPGPDGVERIAARAADAALNLLAQRGD